jgi:imidazolonepropionase
MKLLLENIKELVQVEEEPSHFKSGKEMSEVTSIKNAFLIIRDELIQDFGPMEMLKDVYKDDDFLVEIDCGNRLVYPCYCDSHTHLVYPAPQEREFVNCIRGFPNGEANRREAGILRSTELLRNTSDEILLESAMRRIDDIMKTGTGAVEIKSGYGLNSEDEIRMLNIIKRVRKSTPVCVRSTFFGANAIPLEYKHNIPKYVDLVINEMIPQVAAEELAEFIDVSCDTGFFSVEDTERILMAGISHGMRPKIHANEFGLSGGVQVGVKFNSLSVDNLLKMGADEIESLKNTETMPTVLPGVSFFLGVKGAPVRQMIDAGLPVAMASGYNPASSPSGNMNFIASLGCINYKMMPEEVINATTINTAYAMGISDRLGSIARGKIANIFITSEIPGTYFIPYSFGSNFVETVILNGEIQSV